MSPAKQPAMRARYETEHSSSYKPYIKETMFKNCINQKEKTDKRVKRERGNRERGGFQLQLFSYMYGSYSLIPKIWYKTIVLFQLTFSMTINYNLRNPCYN